MKSETIPLPGVCLIQVCQTGTVLARDRSDAQLILHWEDGAEAPRCAELVGDDLGAEIGLWWEGKRLVDFDGVFEMPCEVRNALRDRGFDVSYADDIVTHDMKRQFLGMK